MKANRKMNKNSLKDYLDRGFKQIGLELNKNQKEQILKYIDFLIQENKKYNLTSITEPKEIVKVHFLDSAGLFLKSNIGGKVIDIGTGAGFPGFVFKILKPDVKLTLLEASLKKANFLKMLQVELELYEDIEVLHARAEDLGQNKDYRFQYDYVTSRAVAPLNILLEYTAPFCKNEGKILLYKGPSYQDELKEAHKAIQKLNLKYMNSYKLDIPFLDGTRYILEFVRKNELSDKYPRRAGIPKKRPL